MQITWMTALQFVGQVAFVSTAVAAILYKAFMKWGEKWIENRFDTRLQELKNVHESRLQDLKSVHESRLQESKHAHERELESVRSSIQNTFSRVSKIHEREFEVLPKIWFLIQDTLGQSHYAVGRTLIYTPDFRVLSDEAIEGFFQSHGFSELQRAEVLKLTDPEERSRLYLKVLMHRYMQEAQEKQRVLNNYIIENRVFMTPELDRLLTDVSHTLASGLSAHELGRTHKDYQLEREGSEKIASLGSQLPHVLNAIQERLCHSAAATKPPFDGTAS